MNSAMNPAMNLVKIVSAIGFVIIASGITYAFIVGDFFAEARILLPYPWMQMTTLDLYAGLLVFSGWVFFRERSRGSAVAWLIALLVTGNLATFAYTYYVANQSKGDWRTFFLGRHVNDSTHNR